MLGLQENINPWFANIVNHYPLMRHVDLNPLRIFGLDIMQNPPLPLWFIRALMLYDIVAPVLLWIASRRTALSIFAGILIVFDSTKNLSLPNDYTTLFAFTLAPVNILAFCFGMYFVDNPVKVAKGTGRILFFSGLLLFFATSFQKLCGISLPYASRVIVSRLAIVLFLAGAWSVCPVVELPKILQKQSFPIYLCHAIFVPYVLLFARKFPPMLGWEGFIANIFFLVAASLFLSHLLRRRLPRFSKILFGGR